MGIDNKNINQNVLIQKFQAFAHIEKLRESYPDLEIRKKLSQLEKKKIEKIPLPEEIKQFPEGLCYGLATIYSYMAAVNQLDWWKKTIEEICAWDEKEESLDQGLDLLLKRAMNYALYNQFEQNFHAKRFNAFEMTENDTVRETDIAGYFIKEDLEKLLDENIIGCKNIIFLCGNTIHATSIRFSSSKWFFYDPNSKTGEKEFSNQSELIDYLFNQLGHSLCFSMLTWNKSNYHTLHDLEKKYQSLYKDNPQKKEQLLLNRKIINRAEEKRSNGLPGSSPFFDNFEKATLRASNYEEKESEAFFTKNNEVLDFCLLSQCSKNKFIEIFKKMSKKPEFFGDFASFIYKFGADSNGLHYILKFYPELFDTLINLAKRSETVRGRFIDALQQKEYQNFRYVLNHYPEKIPNIAEIFNPNSLEGLIQLLIAYHNTRFCEKEYSTSQFFKKPSETKKIKTTVAFKLINFLRRSSSQLEMTPIEVNALKSGRLGGIVNHPSFKEYIDLALKSVKNPAEKPTHQTNTPDVTP